MSSEKYNFPDIIALKQEANVLTRDQIAHFVSEVCNKNIHDAQIGAMLMAIFLQGMTREETAALTECMATSGEVLSWPEEWKHLVVDKHSTGGCGDKVSLILAPALAACGMKVPMISGRSLGHTGGTLDKLESIPGYNVNLSSTEMTNVLNSVGCCIVGQTETIVPADKRLYALRDITSTVASSPLIASSIIAKKAAESLTCLVLDVKYGTGSFQSSSDAAIRLAHLLASTSNAIGINTTAFVTDMEEPLGKFVGNSLEVVESVKCLQGNDDSVDLLELVISQGGELLRLNGRVKTFDDGKEEIRKVLSNGTALEKFKQMIIAQGVSEETSAKVCESPRDVLPIAQHKTILTAPTAGTVTSINARACAIVNATLGAGRSKPGDPVTHDTGLKLAVKTGDIVKADQPWITVYHREELLSESLKKQLENAIEISEKVSKDFTTKIHSIIHGDMVEKPMMVGQ